MTDAELKSWTRVFLKCARSVHRALGPGFEADVYQEALCVELERAGLPFVKDLALPVTYKGEAIGDHVFEFGVDNQFVVLLKTTDRFTSGQVDQLHNLLQFFNLQAGLLLHFSGSRLRTRAVHNAHYRLFPFSLN